MISRRDLFSELHEAAQSSYYADAGVSDPADLSPAVAVPPPRSPLQTAEVIPPTRVVYDIRDVEFADEAGRPLPRPPAPTSASLFRGEDSELPVPTLAGLGWGGAGAAAVTSEPSFTAPGTEEPRNVSTPFTPAGAPQVP